MSEKQIGVFIIDCINNQNELMKDAEIKVSQMFEVKYNQTYEAKKPF